MSICHLKRIRITEFTVGVGYSWVLDLHEGRGFLLESSGPISLRFKSNIKQFQLDQDFQTAKGLKNKKPFMLKQVQPKSLNTRGYSNPQEELQSQKNKKQKKRENLNAILLIRSLKCLMDCNHSFNAYGRQELEKTLI